VPQNADHNNKKPRYGPHIRRAHNGAKTAKADCQREFSTAADRAPLRRRRSQQSLPPGN
jgi:hypothetical protein